MKKINNLSIIAIIAMIVLSVTNLFGFNGASISVILGVIFFFVNKIITKQPFEGSGLDIKKVKADLKDKSIWVWLLLPLVLNLIQIVIAKLFLPEYITYELNRIEDYISKDKYLILVIQFFVLALGEEIAWRAFFQQQTSKVVPMLPVIVFSSLLFALGHYTDGDMLIVGYNILFIFVVSMVFGIIYKKTNNAWVSGIAHFIGNIITFFVIVLFFV